MPTVGLDLSCATRWPCRASARLQLPPEVELDAITTDGPLILGPVDGRFTATTTGDDAVLLGPLTGTVRAVTERGDVIGTGLAAREVEVDTAAGAVHLTFRERPRSVAVVAGVEPVTIELPPGRYAVTVVGSPSATIDVHRDDAADSRIWIDGRGPVRITSTT